VEAEQLPPVAPAFIDADLLDNADKLDATIPRGEARRAVAELAQALARRAPPEELAEAVAAAAALTGPQNDEPLACAVAYRASLPLLARDERTRAPLAEAEAALADLEEEDRVVHGAGLAKIAIPALAIDLELLEDEGYRYVATFPPAGSEGVDVAGKAASWLTRRLTLDGDAPRLAMRRYLAVVAEEVELDLPLTAETIDRLLAEPMPASPPKDRLFLALSRGLVDEAIAERGWPW
jgi:hypothetical protein